MSESKEDTSGPAFPINEMGLNDSTQLVQQHFGMSLRDWFAGLAMQGMLACSEGDGYPAKYAQWSYEYADAMLEAREQ